MIYKSVLVLFTMFTGVFAAADELKETKPCHVGCGGKCKLPKDLFIPKGYRQKVTFNVSKVESNSNEKGSKVIASTLDHKSAALPQQELVVSRVDNASILHAVSSDASKPMILTSIVDVNATKLSVPSAVVVSEDEVLPMQTDTESATSSVREAKKSEEKTPQPEEQYNRSSAYQHPRTQLPRDVVTDVEGENSALKPTEPVYVESDKSTKSKAKKLHKNAEDGKADNHETDAEQDNEGDEEVEDDENSDKDSKKFSLKPKINRGKKSDTSAGA